MLGAKSAHADECFKGNFIGADFGIAIDLKKELVDNWRDFNKKFIPIFLKGHPEKKKVAAGLACGNLWVVCKGIKKDDIVLCPDGTGSYMVGKINDDYSYKPGEILPHRRSVIWADKRIQRNEMSQALQYSTGSIGTVSNISKYAEELEKLMSGMIVSPIQINDPDIENATSFALENQLEEFLVENWNQTELGKKYNIYEVDGEVVGRQFQTDDGGEMDVLAVSKDNKELVVIELKRGRASDKVVGQIQRYMGYAKEVLAEEGQIVKGIIIAFEEDIRLKRALAVTNNIEFFRYKIDFKLYKG